MGEVYLAVIEHRQLFKDPFLQVEPLTKLFAIIFHSHSALAPHRALLFLRAPFSRRGALEIHPGPRSPCGRRATLRAARSRHPDPIGTRAQKRRKKGGGRKKGVAPLFDFVPGLTRSFSFLFSNRRHVLGTTGPSALPIEEPNRHQNRIRFLFSLSLLSHPHPLRNGNLERKCVRFLPVPNRNQDRISGVSEPAKQYRQDSPLLAFLRSFLSLPETTCKPDRDFASSCKGERDSWHRIRTGL